MCLGELTMCVCAQRAYRFYGDETNGCLLLFMSVAGSSSTKPAGVQSPQRIIEIVCVCIWWHKVSLCWPLVDAILSDVVSPLSHLPLSRVCESETGESMVSPCSRVFAVTVPQLSRARETQKINWNPIYLIRGHRCARSSTKAKKRKSRSTATTTTTATRTPRRWHTNNSNNNKCPKANKILFICFVFLLSH